jgi:hypothetical protein
MRVTGLISMIMIAVIIIWSISIADVPHYFSYQGRLMDDAGNPMNATVGLDFGIYSGEYGTGLLWHEVHPSVAVVDGLFNVFLGSGNPMPDSIFDGTVLWLGIKVNDGPIMDPLTPFVASPYSFRAIHADTAEYAMNAPAGTSVWSQSGNYVRLPDVGDSVGIGVLNPVEKLHVGGNILLGAYGDIRFSPDNTRINCESNDLQIKAQSDLYLEPYDDLYIRRRDGGSSWAHFDNSTQRLGIGVLDPPYKLTVNGEISIASGGESKYHINYYQGGLNIAETGVQDRRIHISDGGNVGIGTAGAQEKLHVYGNAKIKDTIKVGAFEENAINRDNIIDEVGLAYVSGSSINEDLTTSYSSYLSKEITVPTSGYILAIGMANIFLFHGISGYSEGYIAISDMPDNLNGSMYQNFYLGSNVSAGSYSLTISCQRLFNVSAGTHTFHFIAKRAADNDAMISSEQMSLLFIPTGYGSKDGVFTAETADNFNEQDMDEMNSELKSAMQSDNSMVEPASGNDGIPVEEQIRSLTAQIEELRKRMEVYEGQ